MAVQEHRAGIGLVDAQQVVAAVGDPEEAPVRRNGEPVDVRETDVTDHDRIEGRKIDANQHAVVRGPENVLARVEAQRLEEIEPQTEDMEPRRHARRRVDPNDLVRSTGLQDIVHSEETLLSLRLQGKEEQNPEAPSNDAWPARAE